MGKDSKYNYVYLYQFAPVSERLQPTATEEVIIKKKYYANDSAIFWCLTWAICLVIIAAKA